MNENIQIKAELKKYLGNLTVYPLRALGRKVGVAQSTEKKKHALIEEIIAVLFGELAPIEPSKRGAPVKNNYIDPSILEDIQRICTAKQPQIAEKKTDSFGYVFQPLNTKGDMLVFEDPAPGENKLMLAQGDAIYKGQFEILNGVEMLLPLDCREKEIILLKKEQVETHDLRVGDIVTCRAKMGEKNLVATHILTINELLVGSFEQRPHFDDCLACYPQKRIRFLGEGEQGEVAMKYLDWISPIGMGQRACIVAPPKAGKTTLLLQLAQAAKKCNRDLEVQVLLIDQSPETVGRFRAVMPENALLYTTYENDAEEQVFAAEFALKRAKRTTEHMRNVLLIVDSLSALARAYNDTEASVGGKVLAGGLESKTLQYIKRYLGTARCLECGGSLTIVGAVSCDTGNPVDELVCSELSAVANFEMHLSDELAAKRVYPALVPLKTRTGGAELMQDGDTEQLLRREYLPTFGVEAFIKMLADSPTQEVFAERLRAEINRR